MRADWKHNWNAGSTSANILPQNTNKTDRNMWKEVSTIRQSKEWCSTLPKLLKLKIMRITAESLNKEPDIKAYKSAPRVGAPLTVSMSHSIKYNYTTCLMAFLCNNKYTLWKSLLATKFSSVQEFNSHKNGYNWKTVNRVSKSVTDSNNHLCKKLQFA